MKSVKPGRGPSMLGAVGGIIVALFGVLWTIIAASIGGGIFAIFGILFVVFAVVGVIYNFRNATSKNRHSSFDIVDAEEEMDPFQQRFSQDRFACVNGQRSKFCPYCGTRADDEYQYCNECGKKLP